MEASSALALNNPEPQQVASLVTPVRCRTIDFSKIKDVSNFDVSWVAINAPGMPEVHPQKVTLKNGIMYIRIVDKRGAEVTEFKEAVLKRPQQSRYPISLKNLDLGNGFYLDHLSAAQQGNQVIWTCGVSNQLTIDDRKVILNYELTNPGENSDGRFSLHYQVNKEKLEHTIRIEGNPLEELGVDVGFYVQAGDKDFKKDALFVTFVNRKPIQSREWVYNGGTDVHHLLNTSMGNDPQLAMSTAQIVSHIMRSAGNKMIVKPSDLVASAFNTKG